ncbi:MAG: amidohydrolase family protein [Desulfovibrionaceae bacterium]
MLYDVHTHAFHPKIAHKVVAQLEDHYGIEPACNGLVEDLLDRARRGGIDKVVALSAATAPAQVVPANNWAIGLMQSHPEIVSFGTLHPEYADWETELARLKAAGIKGLKFHPEFQGFWMDDVRLLPIMEAAQRDFVFLFHVGDRAEPAKNPSCPFKLMALATMFPQARIIAAHLGGYLHWQWALQVLIGKNVWLDTSSAIPYIDPTALNDIFTRHPRERILFGSDYPLRCPAEDRVDQQLALRFSDTEMEELMTNAEALLGG